MRKAWIIVVIVALIAILFFFPKDAGHTGSEFPPPNTIYSWTEKECACLGFKYDATGTLMDAGTFWKCVGMPYSCSCSTKTQDREADTTESDSIACEE